MRATIRKLALSATVSKAIGLLAGLFVFTFGSSRVVTFSGEQISKF